ncbi:MAG: hypothetical protein HY549_08170 [Elusimicrobia bacterium]|nr:hypothetical protein [Elusimicrobiota bacterium]
MNKTILAAVLLAPLALRAAEHPEHPQGQEHPQGHHQGKEHPKHEHPEGSKGWKRAVKKDYTRAVKEHIKNNGGSLKIRDEVLKKDWELSLKRIHKDKIVHLGDNHFFACADFDSTGSKDKVDLDFYALKQPSGIWVIEKVLIHKVNGQPRYTYNERNEIVPIKS